MSAKYRIEIHARGEAAEGITLLSDALSALHPAAWVESSKVDAFPRLGVLRATLIVWLAGQGEADDSVDRLDRGIGLAHDVPTARILAHS